MLRHKRMGNSHDKFGFRSKIRIEQLQRRTSQNGDRGGGFTFRDRMLISRWLATTIRLLDVAGKKGRQIQPMGQTSSFLFPRLGAKLVENHQFVSIDRGSRG